MGDFAPKWSAIIDGFFPNYTAQTQRNESRRHQSLLDFDCLDMYTRNMTDLDVQLAENDVAMRLCHMNIALWNVVPPLYLLVGTFSNVLSIVVWSKKKLAQQTQHVSTMLMWLAIFDLTVLYTGLLKHYLKKSLFRWDLQDGNEFICKFHEFLIYTSLSCASWIVAFVAVDRCACVLCGHPHVRDHATRIFKRHSGSTPATRPHRHSTLCRRPRPLYWAVGGLVFVSVSVNSHIFWTQRISDKEGGCKVALEKYAYFLRHIRPKFDLFFAGVLPIVVLAVATSLLICTICCCSRSSTLRRTPKKAKDSDTGQTETAQAQCSARNCRRNTSAVSKMSNRITWTLISIAICFVLCNVPARIYLMLYPSVPSAARAQPSEYFKYRFIFSVLALLQFLANVINFFIYSVGNEVFRKEVRATLFKRCKSR